MRARTSLGLLLTLVLSACASASIGELEQHRLAEPGSLTANRSLGIAYYRAGRFADARVALATAARLDPRDGETALYRGLAAEEGGDLTEARKAYLSYLEVGRASRVRLQLQSRLAALSRRELIADAKIAVQQESVLGAVAGSSTTIAVMPLRFTGPDSSLRPLERGIAELLTTDLARSSKITVVERARIQALLDEISLQKKGRTDSTTNVRAGRLLRAGRVVQGSIMQLGETQLRMDAAVVDVPTTQIRGTAHGNDELGRVFDLEKRVALDLFREMGVTLTLAERNAIEQRPTKSLAAFLAYSRGLTSEDQGLYDEAGRFYRDAIRLDPGFGAAMQKSLDARDIVRGNELSARSIESGLRGGDRSHGNGGDAVASARETASDLNPSAAGDATSPGRGGDHRPPQKDPASAATNTDAPGRSGRVTIKIKNPKSNQKKQ